MSEVGLLAVHGVLHLLGYDHAEPEKKEKMWQAQQEILTILNVTVNKWPED
jgi:probable rRNA maturation factor